MLKSTASTTNRIRSRRARRCATRQLASISRQTSSQAFPYRVLHPVLRLFIHRRRSSAVAAGSTCRESRWNSSSLFDQSRHARPSWNSACSQPSVQSFRRRQRRIREFVADVDETVGAILRLGQGGTRNEQSSRRKRSILMRTSVSEACRSRRRARAKSSGRRIPRPWRSRLGRRAEDLLDDSGGTQSPAPSADGVGVARNGVGNPADGR